MHDNASNAEKAANESMLIKGGNDAFIAKESEHNNSVENIEMKQPLVKKSFGVNDRKSFSYEMKKLATTLFRAARFFLTNATKSRGSSTTTTNAEVMLLQNNICDVIKHMQFTLYCAWGHKKVWKS